MMILVFTGCTKDDDLDNLATRTILVYMAGDNSLSSFTYKNLQSIIEGADLTSIKNCNLLVYLDAQNSNPKLYKIDKNPNGIADSVLVKTYDEHNSVDKETMRAVIEEVFSSYPADEKGLFLWSHGTAWLPFNLTSLKSFGQDGLNYMEITELKDALPDRFDYIVFDACYMASVEVVYELRDKADYFIGSSTEIMGDGFPYALTIPSLLSDDSLEKRILGVATSFYNYYNAQSGAFQKTGNISVVKTADLELLAADCRTVLLNRYTEEQMVDPSKYGLNIQALEYLTYPYEYSYLYDLEDFLSALNPEHKMDSTAILYKASTPTAFFVQPYRNMPINTYCGLSVYVPQTKNPKMNEWYKRLAWYGAVYE